MFKTIIRNVIKELVLKAFLSILFTGIDFHVFLLNTTPIATMGSQTGLLIDASVVQLVKLNVRQSFPFPPLLKIITRPIGV